MFDIEWRKLKLMRLSVVRLGERLAFIAVYISFHVASSAARA